MNEILEKIVSGFMAQSSLEIVAVITALLYLVLAVRENIWCWFYGFISTAIYIYLFYHVSLLSESLLNFYYLIMAVYGWTQWKKKGLFTELKIHFLQRTTHIKILAVCALLTPIIGYLMNKLGASFPYIDAFVAILAVVATLMTTKKVFENWYYWLVVDLISIYLFWQKQMYLTSLLFVVYIVLIFVGIKHWKKLMNRAI
ncbi:MAG: nicotinamide riboside transporter PnuC [Proteobacteria bacterium]|nr:nicotinamide riboside transporter PnuC [Pseudomonadota bacterium]